MPSKTTRRDAGEGSLYQDKRGLWNAVVELPPGPNGDRRRKVRRARTKDAASDKLKKMMRDLEKAGDLPTVSPTLEQWLRIWLRTRQRQMKPNGYVAYRGAVRRYIIPAMGRHRLDKLTPDHVRDLHSFIIDDKGLSPTTAQNVHTVLHEALKDAMREGRVLRDVSELVDRPRRAVTKIPMLSAEQAIHLFEHTAADPDSVHWYLALLAGLRQGERLGLTREAVDMDRGVITVSWQLQRLRWEHGCLPSGTPEPDDGERWPCGKIRGHACPQRHIDVPKHHEAVQVIDGLWLTRPKTSAGWREVPMAPLLLEVMRRHLERTEPGMCDLILHRGDAARRPIEIDVDRDNWHAALASAGLPPVRVHSARHTTASLLNKLKVTERVRVAIMGHASGAMTARYTTPSDAEMVEAMGKLGDLLTPPDSAALPPGAST